MSTVPFEVVTPDKLLLSREVSMVTLRGGYGELGILPRHTALATTVKPGLVKVKLPDGSEDFIPVTGGFVEVLPTRITLLADAAELPGEIDVERARSAKERAEQRLAKSSDGIDVVRAEAALKRALFRLEAIEMSGKNGNPFKVK
jgi:F-type H+-transporting ATPase subunit epsilon